MSRSMVVAVLWVEGDTDAAVDAVTAALDGVGIAGSGGVGAFREEQIDREFRRDLARVGVEFGPLAVAPSSRAKEADHAAR